MCFTNKVVLITGAASGIGAAIALRFAKLNATLCIIDINEKDLLKTKDKCQEVTRTKIFEVAADLGKDEDVRKTVECALKELKKIDILINCAGVLKFGRLQDSDIVEKFDEVISINLRATLVMTKQALPALIESKGCIINISSVASNLVTKNTLVYNISKAGVTTFTKNTAFELASYGVRVNCISPGPVKTNIWMNAGISKDDSRDIRENMLTSLPLKQYVKVEEIAELAVYLASDKAASITGSDFVVDAGMLLGKNAVGDNFDETVPKNKE